MTKKRIIPFVFGVLLLIPQTVHAYSFAGSDWLLDMSGVLHIDPIIGSIPDQPFSEVDMPTIITQSDNENIIIPISFADPLSLEINVAGTVTGTQLVATAEIVQTESFQAEIEGTIYTLRLNNVEARLQGTADSINSADLTGGFGPRVYGITGDADPSSYITVGSIEADSIFGWAPFATASVTIDAWRADRGAGVPEPGTIAMLLGLAASLAGYGLWRRRG